MDFSHRRNRKTEDYSFSFIHFPFPPHQVIQSPCQIQLDTIPNQATISPRFLLLYFLSFHPSRHVFNHSAFCSFPSSNPSLSPGFQSHPASRGQRARNFWLSSDLSFGRTVLHPPSFFLFSIFIHTSFRACFLSVSSFHHFFFSNIGTTIICFTTKIERHLCYSQIVSLLLFNISLFFLYLICRISFFFFSFLLNFCLFSDFYNKLLSLSNGFPLSILFSLFNSPVLPLVFFLAE